MVLNFRWLCCFLLLTALSARAEPFRLHLSGLDSDLKTNAENHLQSLPSIEPEQLKGMKPEIHKAVQNALKALGYYSSTIEIAPDEKNKRRLNIVVSPGKPVIIKTLDIAFTSEATMDIAFQRLQDDLPFKSGDILNQGTYESVKSRINDLAQSRGYFDAQLTKHVIEIYPEQHVADIHLILDSGIRYHFGDIEYGDMSPATRELLNTLVNFKPGEKYQAIKLSQLYRDISATGYFSQIDVRPLRDKAVSGRIPIGINVVPNAALAVETGIGFSTNEGARVSLTLNKPWLNEKGHSVSSQMKFSQINQEISGSYKIPAGNPLHDYYSLEGGYKRTDLDDTNSQLISASINRWAKNPHSWDRNLFFRLTYEDFVQASQSGLSQLLIPGIAFNQRRVRGRSKLDPESGHLYNTKLELSHTLWGSDTHFAKLWGSAKWLTTVAEKNRFLFRVEQGFIEVDDVNKIPPSIRFFTGGDQSVRGYSYQSISPKDSNGKLIGARYMSAVGIEYNYQFIKNWRAALFTDTGIATNNYKEAWKVGSGFGIRWVTPLGPVKLDLAWALSKPDTPWRIHFSMGPDL